MTSKNKEPEKMQEVSSLEELMETPRSTGLDFPSSPADGQIHRSYVYDATKSAWVAVPMGYTSV